MQTLRVAAVSMDGRLGDPQGVLERIEQFAAQAAEGGAELALFPELVVHGHCTPNTWELAEAVPDGPSTQRLIAIARRHKLFLSAGLSEKERDVVFNTQVVVGPQGYVGKQRKLHCSRDEGLFYKGGREIAVFDLGKCKVGIVICYDNQLPEVPRIAALRGADVLLMPHAAREARWDDTPQSQAAARRHMFDLYTSCYAMRARENACFCVLADQAGRACVDAYPADHPYQPHHAGAAMVFDPLGRLIKHAQLETVCDEIVFADLDAKVLAQARSQPNYTLRTRRPELFGELTREPTTC
jgi:N-carbamoylputrescine amidase